MPPRGSRLDVCCAGSVDVAFQRTRVTHAHPDHQGASHAICTELKIPLWCGDADADAMETEGEIMRRIPRHWLTDTIAPLWVGLPHPVSRRLREGDRVGSFAVIETPGHTAGHISFWRADDGVLVLGDVCANFNIYTGLPMLREPERFFSIDPREIAIRRGGSSSCNRN